MFAHKVRSVYIVALLLIVAAAAYLFWPRERPAQMRADYIHPIPGLKAEEYPVVGGSPVTALLREVILAKAMQLPGEVRRTPDNEVAVTFPRSLDVAKLRAYREKLGKHHYRHYSFTDSAYAALISGKGSRLILVSREPSKAELAKGVELDVKPIALDAFVILVNSKNPVKSLLISEVKEIFSGKITNWEQVGGPDANIAALNGDPLMLSVAIDLARPSVDPYKDSRQRKMLEYNDGKSELLKKLVMDGAPIHLTGGRGIGGFDDAVADDPHAISFSTFYEEGVVNPNSNNRLMAIQDVQPTVESIADASYPFVEPIYAVVRADAKPGSPEVRLRDWLTSKNGQQLVMQAGFIPLTMVKNVPEE